MTPFGMEDTWGCVCMGFTYELESVPESIVAHLIQPSLQESKTATELRVWNFAAFVGLVLGVRSWYYSIL